MSRSTSREDNLTSLSNSCSYLPTDLQKTILKVILFWFKTTTPFPQTRLERKHEISSFFISMPSVQLSSNSSDLIRIRSVPVPDGLVASRPYRSFQEEREERRKADGVCASARLLYTRGNVCHLHLRMRRYTLYQPWSDSTNIRHECASSGVRSGAARSRSLVSSRAVLCGSGVLTENGVARETAGQREGEVNLLALSGMVKPLCSILTKL